VRSDEQVTDVNLISSSSDQKSTADEDIEGLLDDICNPDPDKFHQSFVENTPQEEQSATFTFPPVEETTSQETVPGELLGKCKVVFEEQLLERESPQMASAPKEPVAQEQIGRSQSPTTQQEQPTEQVTLQDSSPNVEKASQEGAAIGAAPVVLDLSSAAVIDETADM
jgi:hypothetical protein